MFNTWWSVACLDCWLCTYILKTVVETSRQITFAWMATLYCWTVNSTFTWHCFHICCETAITWHVLVVTLQMFHSSSLSADSSYIRYIRAFLYWLKHARIIVSVYYSKGYVTHHGVSTGIMLSLCNSFGTSPMGALWWCMFMFKLCSGFSDSWVNHLSQVCMVPTA